MPGRDNTTKRVAMGGWQPAGDPSIRATFWLIVPPIDPVRYEVEVERAGERQPTLTGPDRQSVTKQLEQLYGHGQ